MASTADADRGTGYGTAVARRQPDHPCVGGVADRLSELGPLCLLICRPAFLWPTMICANACAPPPPDPWVSCFAKFLIAITGCFYRLSRAAGGLAAGVQPAYC